MSNRPRALDHHVEFRRRENLAAEADVCRRLLPPTISGWFDVFAFVTQVLPGLIPDFSIEFYDAVADDEPAFVTFAPKTLHIDREVWALASQGEPEARFILSHELGHLLLHDQYAQAFSGEQQKFGPRENSAEWQADTFADLLLVGDDVLDRSPNASSSSKSCGVPVEVATRRLKTRKAPNRPALSGASCPKCGSFVMVRNGLQERCGDCSFERFELA